eukprot:TRINITY_DN46531_c0_g1_i1.p1 TRINITY_DN46531_c0_g1~~TRINITY_DN46531_c0_g1_i1.p1  ORF type:complete len:626 (+),score=135.04 TRINITY_DN46531_c0_g1_i1:157-2034(+)
MTIPENYEQPAGEGYVLGVDPSTEGPGSPAKTISGRGSPLPVPHNYEQAGEGYLLGVDPIKNSYLEDTVLVDILKRLVPASVLARVEPDLIRFGVVCGTEGEATKLAEEMERYPPKLESYNCFGKRIDDVKTCLAWKQMHKLCAREGLVANGYDDFAGGLQGADKQYARLLQFTKLHIYSPASGLYNCPLAMTDGAAALLVDLPSEMRAAHPELAEAAERLTSRDPETFWTAGQWMTERGGGSDVGSGTRTIAKLQPDGSYRLYGYKWFTSGIDAAVTITLARIEDADGTVVQGSPGLSCFFVRVRLDSGELNGLRIVKLKDKFGTHQLPTAEVELCGAQATLISKIGQGIPCIMKMVNVTRTYNAVSATGVLSRIVNLVGLYTKAREAFGRKLAEQPLHLQTMATLSVRQRACIQLTLHEALLLGRIEAGTAGVTEHKLFRLVTPLAKLFTGKLAVSCASEGMESLGGHGYLEASGFPQILRDAQVLPIWEGTSNVQSLDVLRVFRDKSVWSVMEKALRERFSGSGDLLGMLQRDCETFLAEIRDVLLGPDVEPLARDIAMQLSKIYCASLLVEHAKWSGKEEDWTVVELFWSGSQATSEEPLRRSLRKVPSSAIVSKIVFSKL